MACLTACLMKFRHTSCQLHGELRRSSTLSLYSPRTFKLLLLSANSRFSRDFLTALISISRSRPWRLLRRRILQRYEVLLCTNRPDRDSLRSATCQSSISCIRAMIDSISLLCPRPLHSYRLEISIRRMYIRIELIRRA